MIHPMKSTDAAAFDAVETFQRITGRACPLFYAEQIRRVVTDDGLWEAVLVDLAETRRRYLVPVILKVYRQARVELREATEAPAKRHDGGHTPGVVWDYDDDGNLRRTR